ncbi:CD109 antigen isoform X2 [Danio rerio]|uniref:CD109 antigen isoform X2 n=1 Tax=Danio rerio TaxID=7955 RepID=A0A8M3ATH0_DANRE|nr:CD109 antigen isoform X2 [Danio rerio]|eukprot:XP_009293270.1 CD109 antigen isoform X2 [Danio rerio]
MEWLQFFGILVCSLVCRGAMVTSSARQNLSYLISVSEVLRCGVPTTLSVTVLSDYPINVTARLTHGKTSVAQTQSTVPAGSSRLLSLPPVFYDDMTYWYPYQLNVEGFSGTHLVFSNSTSMVFSPRCMSIFIQTDKNYYQPGQTVKFRVVSVTPDGKPYSGRTDIFIRDPRGNMIRQWLAVDSFLGVISKELNISQNPPLGSWKITAGVNDVIHERAFTVDYYVLPRFEVKLDVPSVLYCEDTLMGTVTAKYFYGKPVSGFMDVRFVHGFNGIEMRYDHTEMIEGSAEITFDMKDFSTRFNDYSYSYYDGYRPIEFIDVNVNITESATGLMYNSSARVSIVTEKYKLEFLQYPHIVKPSMTFTAKLKLSLYDQRPLSAEDQIESVYLAVTQHKLSPWTWMWSDGGPLGPRMMNNTPSTSFPPNSDGGPLGPHMMNSTPPTSFTPIYDLPVQNIELPVTADGLMSFQIHLSDSVATLDLEARFKDTVQHLQLYRSYSSPSKSYIQLHRDSEPQVGRSLNFTLESSFNLTKIHYLVTSRAGVVDAGTVQSSSFSLNTDHLWAPQACVMVYYTLPDGEIVNDALHVSFTKVLRNTVSVRWSQDRAEPAESVSLSVSVSEPGSVLGILVVDKATLNSAEDNGLSEKTVLEEFLSYSREMTHTDNRGMKMGDPYSVFTACGVTVLTDARLNQEMATNQEMFPMFREEGLFMTAMPDSSIQEPRQRKDFPETWIWLDANVSDSASAVFSLTVPDSLTSWAAFAIIMSENLGLGISAPAELTVFRDFFMSLDLPAFLIRGELLLLEVNLFNYMDVDLEVIVVVAESGMFEFVSTDSADFSVANVRKVLVLSQNFTMLLFPIKATTLGEIPISVKATSVYSSDWLYKTVLVKPEGLQQSFTQTLFLEFLLQQHTLSRKMTFSFPADVVPNSQRASVSAVGDILGPSIGNLDSLIEMPYGCGEQNMIHFAPNTYVLQYLKSTKQAEEQTRRKAMSYMMEAYERELSYQRVDGSFSAFGDSDESGSTWLSAFVLRCFLQARDFISIEPLVMERTAFWLVAHQESDGSFREPGQVIHTELQGGLDGSVSLTAYVLIALLEDAKYESTHKDSVSLALSFLTSRLAQGISSNYSLSLVAYALSLAKSSAAPSALTTLLNRALVIDGVPTWRSPGSVLYDSWQPRSADIEIAAYVLLTMHSLRLMDEGFALMKWLSQQRNHLGGYGSTQDTVMALHALSVYATFSSAESMDLTIRVNEGSGTVATFSIDKSNYLLQQSHDLPIESKDGVDIEVEAEGTGFALFQLTVFYNVMNVRRSLRRRDIHTDEAFYLYVDIMDKEEYHVNLYTCFRLRGGQGLNQTGMAILDVGLLTGFSLAQDGVQIDDTVRRVETPSGRVILYLDKVTTVEQCIEISTVMDFKVAGVQDAVIMIYDYYEPRRRTVRSYTSERRRDMSVCSFCGSDCSLCGTQGFRTDGTPSINNHPLLALSLTTALILLLHIYN